MHAQRLVRIKSPGAITPRDGTGKHASRIWPASDKAAGFGYDRRTLHSPTTALDRFGIVIMCTVKDPAPNLVVGTALCAIVSCTAAAC